MRVLRGVALVALVAGAATSLARPETEEARPAAAAKPSATTTPVRAEAEEAKPAAPKRARSGKAEAPWRDRTGPATVYRIPIDGIIDLGLAPFVARVVDEAAAAENGVVLLDINTFGGRVDAAVSIRDALIDAPVRTIAFINPRAISAGALISLACHEIVMVSGGTIGAATPVTGGGTEKPEAADEKVMSYMRTEMRSTAERRGRAADIAAAMVDPDIEVEGLSEKGKVLTLTTDEAMRVEIADHQYDTMEEALEALGLGEAKVVERQTSWAEKLARAVSNPIVSSLLLSLGFLGLILELYQPGWGLPGTIGIACLLVFFFGHHVVQLAGLEELLLFALGVGLLLLEALVIPGFGVAGLLGGGLVLAAVILSLLALDLRVSWDLGFVDEAVAILSSAIIMTVGGGFLLVRLLPATGVARRFVLRQSLTGDEGYRSHGVQREEEFPPGTTATALSDLRPAGKVRVAGRRLDAVSEGGYIKAGRRVTIVGWRAGAAVVRKAPAEDMEEKSSAGAEGGAP